MAGRAVGRGRPAGGVFNVLQGDKTAVDELLTNPAIKSISFVGSTPIARYVYETGTAHGKRVQALGGAKNHAVILPDADLDLAADAMVNAGFGSAGERCMAISAAIAVGPIADDLVAKIAERAGTIKTGDGTRNADMGPLVTKVHRDKVASTSTPARPTAPRSSSTGVRSPPTAPRTLLARPDPDRPRQPRDERLHRRDLRPRPVGDPRRVLRRGSARQRQPLRQRHRHLHQRRRAARRFQNEVEVGMVGINVPIPVPMAYYSFGGWKNSLFGDLHAHGAEGVHFFTRGKVVTTRWLDPSHGGINLGFPQNH